jgi:hypothetical protein
LGFLWIIACASAFANARSVDDFVNSGRSTQRR